MNFMSLCYLSRPGDDVLFQKLHAFQEHFEPARLHASDKTPRFGIDGAEARLDFVTGPAAATLQQRRHGG